MGKVMDSINDYSQKTDNVNLEAWPQMDSDILEVYAKYAPRWDKPDLVRLCLRGHVESLNDLHQKLEKSKKNELFHKILSVALLAISVAIIATGIILACTVQPELLLVVMASFIPFGITVGMTN